MQGRQIVSRRRGNAKYPKLCAIPTETPSPSTCYPESRRRALVSRSGEGSAPLACRIFKADRRTSIVRRTVWPTSGVARQRHALLPLTLLPANSLVISAWYLLLAVLVPNMLVKLRPRMSSIARKNAYGRLDFMWDLLCGLCKYCNRDQGKHGARFEGRSRCTCRTARTIDSTDRVEFHVSTEHTHVYERQ
jgi:hypothetical protein